MGPARTVVAALCAAEVLAMAGTMSFQALIPTFIAEWQLTHSQVGWISGITYGAYVAGVPILVSLTDRIDARRIVIVFSLVAAVSSIGFAWFAQGFWSALAFRALGGLALGGTYMPGLKALTDRVEGPYKTRYQSFYTASFSVGSSVSLFITGLLAEWYGWAFAFAVAGIAPLLAVLVLVRWVRPVVPARQDERQEALLDFRPVLRQRESMSYVLGYAAHCWELFAFRTWLVAFMTFTAVAHASAIAESTITTLASLILLLGLPASVLGNEIATRLGRRRVLIGFMLASTVLAAAIGFAAALPFWAMTALLAVYGVTVMLDSASLTVGALGAAAPERRGSTLAVHTTLGTTMAFLAPLASGFALDLTGGGATVSSWVACFLVLAAGIALGPLALWGLGGREAPQEPSQVDRSGHRAAGRRDA
jgi:MFS family permease